MQELIGGTAHGVGGEDMHALLDRIGAPYGFSVKDAIDNYEAPVSAPS
jgi:hypothetical protein